MCIVSAWRLRCGHCGSRAGRLASLLAADLAGGCWTRVHSHVNRCARAPLLHWDDLNGLRALFQSPMAQKAATRWGAALHGAALAALAAAAPRVAWKGALCQELGWVRDSGFVGTVNRHTAAHRPAGVVDAQGPRGSSAHHRRRHCRCRWGAMCCQRWPPWWQWRAVSSMTTTQAVRGCWLAARWFWWWLQWWCWSRSAAGCLHGQRSTCGAAVGQVAAMPHAAGWLPTHWVGAEMEPPCELHVEGQLDEVEHCS